MRRILAGLIGLLALPVAGGATAATIFPPDTPVPGHPGLTYLDLLRQVIPDLATDPGDHQIHGHMSAPLRHLAGPDHGGDPPDPVTVTLVDVRTIRAGGQPRLVVMADLGTTGVESTTLVALYDDSRTPKLLDKVDVGLDRDTGFSEQGPLTLGPGDNALISYSEHFNTSQTYQAWLLLFVRHDRFALIDTQYALASRACGWSREETPVFSTRPDPGRPYRRVVITVREKLVRDGADGCGDDPIPRPDHHLYRAEFRWNPATRRFETRSTDLKRLDRLNQASF